MKNLRFLAISIFILISVFMIADLFFVHIGMAEDTIIYTKPVKAVIFNHKAHTEDYGISCNICHDKLFQMEALSVEKNIDFNHKSFSKGKYCGACHDGKKGFAMDKQCTKCHIGVKGLNTKIKK